MAPELRLGSEIGQAYADTLLREAQERNGIVLMARIDDRAVGFICGWLMQDDDMLLRDDARAYAYISDLYVDEAWRRRGVGRQLLQAAETEMRRRGARQMRICSKAHNRMAVASYQSVGYSAYEVTFWKRIE